MKSKQQIGHEYRLKTLMLLARLGYATTRQIAMGVMGSCDLSGRKMAGRTIRRLLALGYLVEKRDGDTVAGERLVALNRAGVAALAQLAPLPDGREHARDWLRHAHKHRTACNSVFVSQVRGLDIDAGWTELEIRARVAPVELADFKYSHNGEMISKIPDLLLHAEEEFPPIWVEVENTWRSGRDFEKLVAFLRCIFALRNPPIHKVWFVVTSPAAKTIKKRLNAAMTHTSLSGYGRQVKELDARILEKHIAVFQLDADKLQLTLV